MNTAIANNHNFYQAYIHLAELYRREGNQTKAITTLEEKMKINPQNPYLGNNLACLYIKYQSGHIDKALGLAQMAYEGLS